MDSRTGSPATVPWDWEDARRRAGVTADGRFNAGLVEMRNPRALVWHRADGDIQVLTGGDLRALALRLAGAMRHAGVGPGDRVMGILGRRPEAFAAPLAAWWLGAVWVPLFAGFGSEAIRVRHEDCGATVAVTDTGQRAHLGDAQGPGDLRVLVVDGAGADGDLGDASSHPPVAGSAAETRADDPAILMYTSGTTAAPKGCVIPHRGVISLWPYVSHGLGMTDADVVFSSADPGWSFGLLTTGLAPLSLGCSRVLHEPAFSAAGWWDAMGRSRVTHLASAPTGFRQLLAESGEVVTGPPTLRSATSAGEPLPPRVGADFHRRFGVSVNDSYGLTECGMLLAQRPGSRSAPAEPGVMGTPVPGFEVQLLDERGGIVADGEPGVIAVRDDGNLLACDYWGRSDEWRARIRDGWWVTEDVARRGEDGRLRYVGRRDDIIVTAGYNVSPVEVETALGSHPAVADVACVAGPDPRKGTAIVAVVVLSEAGAGSDLLLDELRVWVGERLGWHTAPRQLVIADHLPRTESGKLRRAELTRTVVPPAVGTR